MKIGIEKLQQQAGIAKHGLGYTCWEGQLERFAQLVRNAALEDAANAVQAEAHMFETLAAAKSCADAIRNMKGTT